MLTAIKSAAVNFNPIGFWVSRFPLVANFLFSLMKLPNFVYSLNMNFEHFFNFNFYT